MENAEAKGNESLAENCRKRLKNIPEAKFLNKSNFENDKNKGGQALLIILVLLSIVGYGICTFLFCKWYSEKSISLLIMVIILATIPFLLGIGMQYALKLDEEKYEYVDKGYVSGGYEYTKYDVKDSNGKQLGTIETKGEYKEGYSYVKGTAYKTIYHYKCSCCGYEHKK